MSSYYVGDDFATKSNSKSTNSRREYVSGPNASSYEDYIHKIYKPGHRLQQSSQDKLYGDNPERGISARSMLRMGDALGKEALDDRFDGCKTKADNDIEYNLLDRMYTELGASGLIEEKHPYKRFQVYQPKQSSEYYSVMHSRRLRDPTSLINPYREAQILSSTDRTTNRRASEESGRRAPVDDRSSHMLVDYKNFNSSPLSPYMYQSHPYVHREDSRIVGSDFVMLTLRPRDAFLERIDKTLADARAIPRY